MSTYVIGDIHGCFDELQKLLALINFKINQDQLWFTGDLINGGTKSVETLIFIKALGEHAICILGNHDLTLLAIAYADLDIINDREIGFDEILNCVDKHNLLTWLKTRPLSYYEPKFNTLLIHAGVAPQWTLKQTLTLSQELSTIIADPGPVAKHFFSQMFGNYPAIWDDSLTGIARLRCIANYLTRARFCYPTGELDFSAKGTLANAPENTLPWFMLPQRQTKDVTIVFGHWAALNGKTNQPNVLALDTGCVWGNGLSAVRLEDKQRFFVKVE